MQAVPWLTRATAVLAGRSGRWQVAGQAVVRLCHGWMLWTLAGCAGCIYRRIYNNIIKEIDLRFDFVCDSSVYYKVGKKSRGYSLLHSSMESTFHC